MRGRSSTAPASWLRTGVRSLKSDPSSSTTSRASNKGFFWGRQVRRSDVGGYLIEIEAVSRSHSKAPQVYSRLRHLAYMHGIWGTTRSRIDHLRIWNKKKKGNCGFSPTILSVPIIFSFWCLVILARVPSFSPLNHDDMVAKASLCLANLGASGGARLQCVSYRLELGIQASLGLPTQRTP